jgi:hypothetical protein
MQVEKQALLELPEQDRRAHRAMAPMRTPKREAVQDGYARRFHVWCHPWRRADPASGL